MKINLNSNEFHFFWVYFNNVNWDTEIDGETMDPQELGLTPNQMVYLEKADLRLAGTTLVDVEDILAIALETLSDNAGYCVLDSKIDRIVYVNESAEERLTITVGEYF